MTLPSQGLHVLTCPEIRDEGRLTFLGGQKRSLPKTIMEHERVMFNREKGGQTGTLPKTITEPQAERVPDLAEGRFAVCMFFLVGGATLLKGPPTFGIA